MSKANTDKCKGGQLRKDNPNSSAKRVNMSSKKWWIALQQGCAEFEHYQTLLKIQTFFCESTQSSNYSTKRAS